MAIKKSAKEAIGNSARKRVYNLRRKAAMQDVVKQIKKLLAAGKKEEAAALLPKAYQVFDKAAKTNYLKKNTASRKKSRLAAFIKKAV